MKKLTLALDALQVESFATDLIDAATGTVAGNALAKTDVRVDCGSWIDACPTRGCSLGDYTCVDTCGKTYDFTCTCTV